MAPLGQRNIEETLSYREASSCCDLKATNIVLQGLAVPVFTYRDDPIACLNKAMDFLPLFKMAGLLCNKFKGGKDKSYAGTSNKGNATSFGGNNTGGQTRVFKCYNCQDERHMARQCTQPKRPRNAAWFKARPMMAGAWNLFKYYAYDSDCDDVSNAKAVLMANLSNYGSDVISEVPHSESYHNAMDNQSVHEMQDFEQTPVVYFPDNEITSDSDAVVVRLLYEVLQLPMQCT
ncbi:retrovirus-related pol polyprotein from transposon TNT 1-94 [Tanacetum coccineum]